MLQAGQGVRGLGNGLPVQNGRGGVTFRRGHLDHRGQTGSEGRGCSKMGPSCTCRFGFVNLKQLETFCAISLTAMLV